MAKFSSPFILSPTPVRLAFVHLTTGKPNKKGVTKYGATLLVPKSKPGIALNADEGAILPFRQLVRQVLAATVPNGPIPAKLGIRDGDLPNSNGNIATGFPGNWVVGCEGNHPVGLYTAGAQKTLDEKLFYSGCWAIAQVNAFWFDVDNSRGVSFGLGAVQFHHDDERLTAGAPAPAFSAVPGSAAAKTGATGDSVADFGV
jgi:hypothetical protein